MPFWHRPEGGERVVSAGIKSKRAPGRENSKCKRTLGGGACLCLRNNKEWREERWCERGKEF